MAKKTGKKTEPEAQAEAKVETEAQAEPKADEQASKPLPTLEEIPTLEKLMGDGRSLQEAKGDLAYAEALAAGLTEDEAAQLAHEAYEEALKEEAQKDLKEALGDSEKINEALEKAAPPSGKAYKVFSTSRKGFWRIGRKFGPAPVVVESSSLTQAEVTELEASNPKYLCVVKL